MPTINTLPHGIPVGTEYGVYPLTQHLAPNNSGMQVEAERRVGKPPSGEPVATGTVGATGEVSLNLATGEYVLHATVPGSALETVAGQARERERYISFRA